MLEVLRIGLRTLIQWTVEFVVPEVLIRRFSASVKAWLQLPRPLPNIEDYPGKHERHGMLMQTVTRWILTAGSVLLGAWISISGSTQIAPDTVNFVNAFPAVWRPPIAGWTVVFWLLALLWTRALFLRLKAEDRSEDRYKADLMRALYSLPNLDVLWQYHTEYFAPVAQRVLDPPRPVGREALAKEIRDVLEVVAKMARAFSRSNGEAYGASVMLVIGRADIPRVPEPYRTRHRADGDPVDDGDPDGLLRFAGTRTDVAKLDGLLVLTNDLMLPSIPGDDQPTKNYPVLSLPIRKQPTNEILPGAPTAVLNDRLSAYDDTRLLADGYCTHVSDSTREEVRRYFAEGGPGGSIRSLASIRIGTEADPIGVLSIDTDGTYVLGRENTYHKTFYALVRPLLRLLETLVRDYAIAWWEEVESAPSAPDGALTGEAPPADTPTTAP